jgi:hypothetical protein
LSLTKLNDTFLNIYLPNLKYISDYLKLGKNRAVISIVFDSLIRVGTYLSVEANMALSVLMLPMLGWIGGFMSISFNSFLTFLALPSVTYVGEYVLIESLSLSVTLPSSLAASTTTFQSCCISVGTCVSTLCNYNAAIFTTSTTIGDNLYLYRSSLTTYTNNFLTSVGGSFNVVLNSMMSTIVADSLRIVGLGLQITGNTALTFISFPMLKTVGGNVVICSNTGGLSIPMPLRTSSPGWQCSFDDEGLCTTKTC